MTNNLSILEVSDDQEPVRIEPTPGRIVLFHPNRDEYDEDNRLIQRRGDAPLPAIVTAVSRPSETWLLNLTVFDAVGRSCRKVGVFLFQPGEPVPAAMAYCTWIDYQIGQAAKARQPHAQLDAHNEPQSPAPGSDGDEADPVSAEVDETDEPSR